MPHWKRVVGVSWLPTRIPFTSELQVFPGFQWPNYLPLQIKVVIIWFPIARISFPSNLEYLQVLLGFSWPGDLSLKSCITLTMQTVEMECLQNLFPQISRNSSEEEAERI